MNFFFADIPWAEEGPTLLRLALPIVFTALIQQIGSFITQSFVGRIQGDEYMGAVALGGMLCNVTGYSLSYGMCTALDALISQAYGAQEYRLLGLHTQRAMVILTLFSIPVGFIWWKTTWLLINVLGIDPLIADLAGQWAHVLIIGLWPSLIFEILKKFLQGQQIIWPSLLASIVRTVATLVFSIWFSSRGNGFVGIALASVAAQWSCLIAIVVSILGRRIYIRCVGKPTLIQYTTVSTEDADNELTPSLGKGAPTASLAVIDPEDNWPELSAHIFQDWTPFFKLGIPGALSLFVEW
jgi:Na+-driven multidrug efflux pump